MRVIYWKRIISFKKLFRLVSMRQKQIKCIHICRYQVKSNIDFNVDKKNCYIHHHITNNNLWLCPSITQRLTDVGISMALNSDQNFHYRPCIALRRCTFYYSITMHFISAFNGTHEHITIRAATLDRQHKIYKNNNQNCSVPTPFSSFFAFACGFLCTYMHCLY